MAGGGAIRAAKAFVELSLKGTDAVQRGLKRVQRQLQTFAGNVGALGLRMTGLGTLFAAPLVAFIRRAGDAQEALSRFGAVFGPLEAQAAAFADGMAERIGRSALQIKDDLSTFGSFFAGLDFNSTDALKMSQAVEQMALDFASFNNLSDEEAVQRFISGLSGSSEVFDRFGVNIKAAALDAEFLRQGLNVTTATATEQQKVMARLSIIRRSMKQQGAIDDAFRTRGSFNNQWKRLTATLSELAVTIGEQLIPIANTVVTAFSPIVKSVAEWIAANPELSRGIAYVTAGTLALGAGLTIVAGALSLAAFALGPVITLIGALSSPIGLAIGLTAALLIAFEKLTGGISTAVNSLSGVWTKLLGDFGTAFSAIISRLSSGDLAGAAEIGFSLLELQWLKLTSSISGIWFDFSDGIIDAATETYAALTLLTQSTLQTVQSEWTKFRNGLADVSDFLQVEAGLMTESEAGERMRGRSREELDQQTSFDEARRTLEETIGVDLSESRNARQQQTDQREADAADRLRRAREAFERATAPAARATGGTPDATGEQAAAEDTDPFGIAAALGSNKQSGENTTTRESVGQAAAISLNAQLRQGEGPMDKVAAATQRTAEAAERTNELLAGGNPPDDILPPIPTEPTAQHQAAVEQGFSLIPESQLPQQPVDEFATPAAAITASIQSLDRPDATQRQQLAESSTTASQMTIAPLRRIGDAADRTNTLLEEQNGILESLDGLAFGT